MKERPIIFNTEMVKAILEGRKTQTRRTIKSQPIQPAEGAYFDSYNHTHQWNWWSKDNKQFLSQIIICPYGQSGDKLWVRETWRIESFMPEDPMIYGFKDGTAKEENDEINDIEYEDWVDRIGEQSTEDCDKAGLKPDSEEGYYHWEFGQSPCRWRPSIHMPRWASRILLEITDVRVERVQEISFTDVKKEGVEHAQITQEEFWEEFEKTAENPKAFSERWEKHVTAKNMAFAKTWNSINGKDAWEKNPWVWVVTFKRVKP